MIAAPAGYGKSTLARQLAARFELAATCDCANVATERDLWYAILVAVRQAELASRAAATSHRADAGADPTFDNVLALVGELDGSVALVFENAETAFADPALRRSLKRLVAASPRSCTTLLCARTRARMQLSKFAAPHEMLVWRARDLAFDRDEIGRVFGGRGDGPDVVDKIAAATSGWPVAVLFLQRFVNRIGLDAALHRFGETEFEQLHEYLIEEVLAEFSSQELQAVLACSVAPDPTAEDVGNVVADVAPNALLSALTDACPLVGRIDAERFTLHPLLLAALQIRFADQRRTLGRDLARKYESQGRFVRAAQIYHTLGEVDAMARALIADNTNPERTRTIGYSALLATLDDRILAQYPILQALTIYWRRFRVDPQMLREQTEVVWETLRASASLELRANVGATIARMMYETGAFTRAEGLLRGLEEEFGGIPEVPTTAGQAYVARTLGCIAARSGRIFEAERYFRIGYLARPGSEHVRSRYFIERALIERLGGRTEDERRLLALALDSARVAQAPVQAACALAEAAFGAWFNGDDGAFAELLGRLDLEAHANGYVAFTHLCGVGSGLLDVSPNGTEQPNWLACARLVASAATAGEARTVHARAAKDAADRSSDAFLQVLASMAVALTDAAQHDEMFARARAIAETIEAPLFRAAVNTLAAGGDGAPMLSAFVRRFRTDAANSGPVLRIEVLGRRVYRDETPVEIGERQVALLVALARERRTYGRAALTEELWPALSEAGAREALNSCVYRIRSRLGPGIVVFERDAYRLGEGVRVDVRDLERAAAIAQRRAPLTEQERTLLETMVRRYGLATLELSEAFEFLSPILARAAQMTQAIAERLAQDALQARAPERALTIARELIASDPCDEQARDIAIRALLAKGERSAALLELRSYRKVLWHELEVQPSAALTALLQERPAAQLA